MFFNLNFAVALIFILLHQVNYGIAQEATTLSSTQLEFDAVTLTTEIASKQPLITGNTEWTESINSTTAQFTTSVPKPRTRSTRRPRITRPTTMRPTQHSRPRNRRTTTIIIIPTTSAELNTTAAETYTTTLTSEETSEPTTIDDETTTQTSTAREETTLSLPIITNFPEKPTVNIEIVEATTNLIPTSLAIFTTTRLTTTRRPTTIRPRVCKDTLNPRNTTNCNRLRQQGLCQDRCFESLMRETCHATCGFCRPTTGNNRNNGNRCTENLSCPRFASSCNIRANTFLRQVCPVTCNSCGVPAITRRPQNNNNRG